MCHTFLLAELLPKSVTPEDVLLWVVSHFTDFSFFVFIVHYFKDSIIVFFLIFILEFHMSFCAKVLLVAEYWEQTEHLFLPFEEKWVGVQQMMYGPFLLVTFIVSSVRSSLPMLIMWRDVLFVLGDLVPSPGVLWYDSYTAGPHYSH